MSVPGPLDFCMSLFQAEFGADYEPELPRAHLQMRVGKPNGGKAKEAASDGAQLPGALVKPEELGKAINRPGGEEDEIEGKGEGSEAVAYQPKDHPCQQH